MSRPYPCSKEAQPFAYQSPDSRSQSVTRLRSFVVGTGGRTSDGRGAGGRTFAARVVERPSVPRIRPLCHWSRSAGEWWRHTELTMMAAWRPQTYGTDRATCGWLQTYGTDGATCGRRQTGRDGPAASAANRRATGAPPNDRGQSPSPWYFRSPAAFPMTQLPERACQIRLLELPFCSKSNCGTFSYSLGSDSSL